MGGKKRILSCQGEIKRDENHLLRQKVPSIVRSSCSLSLVHCWKSRFSLCAMSTAGKARHEAQVSLTVKEIVEA